MTNLTEVGLRKLKWINELYQYKQGYKLNDYISTVYLWSCFNRWTWDSFRAFLYLSSIVTVIFAKTDRKRSYTQKS